MSCFQPQFTLELPYLHPVTLSTAFQRSLLTKGVSPPPWSPLPFLCFPWAPYSCLFWKNPHFPDVPVISAGPGFQPICRGHLSWHCLSFTKPLGHSEHWYLTQAGGTAPIHDDTPWVPQSFPKPLGVISNVNKKKVSTFCGQISDLLGSSWFPNAPVLWQWWYINLISLCRLGLGNLSSCLSSAIPFLVRPGKKLNFQRILLLL